MSDENDEDDDAFKPQPRSPILQKIADLMYRQNKSYEEAYDLVMNPQSEVQQSDTVTDEVRQTIREIQQTIKKNQEATAKTNASVRDFTVQGYLLDKLKEDVGLIEAEKENVAVVKAGWLRKKAKSAEVARKIMKFAKEMDGWKAELQKKEDAQNERAERIKEVIKEIKQIEGAINGAVKKGVKKTHGYVKKISKSQLKEFEQD